MNLPKLKFNRLPFFVAVLMVCFLIMIVPSLLPVQSTAQKQATVQQNNVQSQQASAASIFNNNLVVSGITLIPFVGWGYLIFALWNTGVVIASYGHPWYWILNNVFAWIELAVYSYVILQSWKLLSLFKQRKTKFTDLDGKQVVRKTTGVYPEIAKTVAYTFIVMVVVLFVSAMLEYLLIRGAI